MFFSILKKFHTNQKGQVFVIVFIMMILALTIGISVSSKFISRLSTFERSDESNRALSIAESLIEHLLALPITTLEGYAINNNCGTTCHLEIISAEGRKIMADAQLTVLGNSGEPYTLDLQMDETAQISLLSYPSGRNIHVCWTNPNMSVTALYISGASGSYTADAYSYNAVSSPHPENNFSSAAPLFSYENCFTITSLTNSVMLRLKALYAEDAVVIIPDSGVNLPNQGVVIKSIGVSGPATRTVSVIVTDPTVPAQFDYVLYQKSTTEPLSN